MVSVDTVVTTFTAGFGIAMAAMLAVFFRISITVKADYAQSMDPAYPYIQAVAMHNVNGRPFINYLSDALIRDGEVVDGVNVTEELGEFGEKFNLVNSDGEIVASTEGEGTKTVVLAVPPGGHLVMKYEWP